MEKAAAAGQDLAAASPQDGTFVSGVRRIRDVLPIIMTDIIQSAPEDHKVSYKASALKTVLLSSAQEAYWCTQDKISKLVEIWERGNTFPTNMLTDFKALLQARSKPGIHLA